MCGGEPNTEYEHQSLQLLPSNDALLWNAQKAKRSAGSGQKGAFFVRPSELGWRSL